LHLGQGTAASTVTGRVKCFKWPRFEHFHFTEARSDASPATKEVKNEHHKGDYEQDMNETAGDMKGKSSAPKEQKKNGDE